MARKSYPDLPPKQKSANIEQSQSYPYRSPNPEMDTFDSRQAESWDKWEDEYYQENMKRDFENDSDDSKSIPGDLNWLKEEGEEMEHPQLKMCKDCSDFLRKLSTERAFGDPHRQMAQQYYAKLSDMAGVKMDPQGSGEGSAMSPQTYDDWMTDVGEWHNPDGTEATDYMDDGPIELNPDWDVGQNDYKAARKPRAPKPITYEDMQALRDPDEGAQFIPDYDDPEIEQTLNTMYRTPTGKPKSPKAQERVTQQALRALRDPSDPTPKPKKARDSRAAAQARRVPPEALTPQALEGLKDPALAKAYQAKKSLGDVLDEQNSQLQHLQKTLEALNSVL